jgi:hypothetical protein
MKSTLQSEQEILMLTISSRKSSKEAGVEGSQEALRPDDSLSQNLHLHRIFNQHKLSSLPQFNMPSTAPTTDIASSLVPRRCCNAGFEGDFQFEMKSMVDIGSLNFRTTVRAMITQVLTDTIKVTLHWYITFMI